MSSRFPLPLAFLDGTRLEDSIPHLLDELLEAFGSVEDNVLVQQRRGELKNLKRDGGHRCERALVAELENLLLEFDRERGKRGRGRLLHVGDPSCSWS